MKCKHYGYEIKVGSTKRPRWKCTNCQKLIRCPKDDPFRAAARLLVDQVDLCAVGNAEWSPKCGCVEFAEHLLRNLVKGLR